MKLDRDRYLKLKYGWAGRDVQIASTSDEGGARMATTLKAPAARAEAASPEQIRALVVEKRQVRQS